MTHWPVAIVGGGPAASATAIGLGRAGVAALILERGDDTGDKIGETLPPESRPLLTDLGLDLDAAGHLPSHGNRSCWGADEVVERSFISSPYGNGWHLDRRRFEADLADVAVGAGATRLTGASAHAIAGGPGDWHLELADGRDVTAGFLVDASGRAAWLARRLGARRRRADQLVGLVAFLGPADTPDRAARTEVEAVADGWWYSAPIPDGRLATAYVTDPALLDRDAARDPDRWWRLVAAAPHTADRIDRHGYRALGARLVGDASGSLLEPACGPGWLAVGDAAVAYDPLTSYGITAALAGGLAAADAILTGRIAEYAEDVATGFAMYERMRTAYYRAEPRWADAPFWRRHRVPIAAVSR